jgi:OTU domain-containing protein 6
MFRALVQGKMLGGGSEAIRVLSLEEETVKADLLREQVCDELLLRREDVEPFLESRIEDYVRRMRMEGTWGGEPELAMAAHVLQRKVVVYMLKSGFQGSLFLEKISEYEPSGIQKTHDNTVVNLLYSGSCHYDALVFPSTTL